MPLAALLALTLVVTEPRIPAGGPGGNTHDAALSLRGEATTTHLRATLVAPPPTPLLSTGFPFTEGTPLWSFETDAARLDLRYLFPMRGSYALDVEETRAGGGIARRSETIAVPEDPRVLRADAIFAAALVAVGALVGFFLARGLTLRRIAPHAAASLAIAVLLIPALAGAMPMGAIHAGPKTGTLWPVTASVVGRATFEIRARNVEDAKPLIDVAVRARDGRLHAGLQFYDGAAHELRIRATRDGKLLREWTQAIEVSAQAPPLGRRIWALVMMLAIFGVGYAAGTGVRLRAFAVR